MQRWRGRERRRAALALDVSRTPKHLPFASPEPSKASGKATCKFTWPSVTSSEALRTPKQEPVQSQEHCPGWCVVFRIMGGRLYADCTPRFRASHTHRRRDTRWVNTCMLNISATGSPSLSKTRGKEQQHLRSPRGACREWCREEYPALTCKVR